MNSHETFSKFHWHDYTRQKFYLLIFKLDASQNHQQKSKHCDCEMKQQMLYT